MDGSNDREIGFKVALDSGQSKAGRLLILVVTFSYLTSNNSTPLPNTHAPANSFTTWNFKSTCQFISVNVSKFLLKRILSTTTGRIKAKEFSEAATMRFFAMARVEDGNQPYML